MEPMGNSAGGSDAPPLVQVAAKAILPLEVFLVASTLVASLLYSIAYIRYSYDDTAYHVPMAVETAKHLNPYYVPGGSSFTSFWFPAGAETLVALVVSVTRSINSTNFSGALVFAGFLAVSYKFAELWTSDRRALMLAVLLVATVPILLAQTMAFYVDLHLNFLAYLSLYLFCRSLLRGRAADAYFGLGAAVLTASVKYQGLSFWPVLLPAGIYCALVSRRKRPGKWSVIFLAACLLFTSGWYVRNWMAKGNPVYPFPAPDWIKPVLAVSGAPYAAPLSGPSSPDTSFPHPFIPGRLVQYKYRPYMTADAFGGGFTLSVVLVAAAGLLARRLEKPRFRMLLFLAVVSIALVAATPLSLAIPRYVLLLPAIAALAAPILVSVVRSRIALALIYSSILVWGMLYVGVNLYAGDRGSQSLIAVGRVLQQGQKAQIARYDWVDEGGLRIGYVNGGDGFIGSLYDQRLTNELFQLHYADYFLDQGSEWASEVAFVTYVRGLGLDHIIIFDENAPTAQIVRDNFADLVR